jgi:uncharacterized protein involved in type VI secretion and phage assembly
MTMQDELLADLVRRVQGRYFGKYRGFVVSNEDPDKLGRVQLRIPSVLGDQTSAWALPCLPFGGLPAQGLFSVPEVDAQVWVEFEEGDLRRPIWTGTFWQQPSDTPPDAQKSPPTTRLLQTPSGHVLQFDDEEGQERIRLFHKGGSEVLLDEQGSISLTDAQGQRLALDASAGTVVAEDGRGNALTLQASGVTIEDMNGNRIELAAAGIKVSATRIVLDGTQVLLGGDGGEPVIKGSSFLTLLATHIHTSVPTGGPTSPPIPQGEATTLSMSVTTR